VTAPIGAAQARDAVVVAGIVVGVEPGEWVGGPVLEVQLRDQSGAVGLAFFGRRSIGGIEPGAFLTAAGTIGHHVGDRVILNPRYWLSGPGHTEADVVELRAPAGAEAAIGRPRNA